MQSMNNTQNTGSSQEVFASEPRVYELGFLLSPTVNEGDLQEKRDALVAIITKAEGIVIDEGFPVLINLAYQIDVIIKNKKHQYDQGYFGWIKFDIAPHHVAQIHDACDTYPDIFRFLLIKTTRENTVTSEQPFKVAQESHDPITEDIDETTNDDVDDFTKIEGVGPVIAETLQEQGITTFDDLAESEVDHIEELIGDVQGSHDPGTWPKQAALARDGKWDELQELQEQLKGGVEQ